MVLLYSDLSPPVFTLYSGHKSLRGDFGLARLAVVTQAELVRLRITLHVP